MMKFFLLAGVMIASCATAFAQKKSYGLKPVTLETYQARLAEHPDEELVDLETFIPKIVLDIRYATTNNFVHEKIYNLAKAYARRPVAEALKRAQEEFNKKGIGIKIYDGYRPYAATVKFYEAYHDTTFVASPYRGSRHNRGCAIDMTLVDLATGKELRMPTGYDSFSKQAYPTYPVKDREVRDNRTLLISVMQRNGFKVNSAEWWHFDYVGWQKYDVMDIPFEELEQ